jgi:pyruvate, water dikinase
MEKHILFFKEATKAEYHLLGGKGASLASMSSVDFPVPMGFSVTTHAYQAFLDSTKVDEKISELLQHIDFQNITHLDKVSHAIRTILLSVPMPQQVQDNIRVAYRQLCAMANNTTHDLPVAVRSSATAEDLPDASFAGQQDTYLWILGEDAVLENVKKCWASLFTSRAINYRRDQKIADNTVLMSVVIQKMVNAKCAGVAMTLNPTNGDRSKIVIDSAWGLGESVVSGEVTPDNFLVDKIILATLKSNIQNKHIEHIPDIINRCVVTKEITDARATQSSLTPAEIKELCTMAKRIEKHYACPQDIEWAIDADLPEGKNLTLLQSRPETVWSQKKQTAASPIKTGMEGLLGSLLNPLSAKKI